MGRLKMTVGALGLGAGLMYLFDPDLGRRRRSSIRDQIDGVRDDLGDFYAAAAEDLTNRGRDLAAMARLRQTPEMLFDQKLEQRARAALPSVVLHPGALSVEAHGGRMIVSGPILEYETSRVMERLSALPGVSGVENRLEPHATPAGIPALQGAPNRFVTREDWRDGQWSPGIRLLAGAGGGALTLYGGLRGGVSGQVLRLAGIGLALRGVFNKPLAAALRQNRGEGTVDVRKDIVVNAPAGQVFRLWSNLENLPRFMEHIQAVQVTGDGRSHWKAAGPGGLPVEWDAMITAQIPNRGIAWRSLPDQPVVSTGQVWFTPLGADRTRVSLRMSYSPPAGVVEPTVAKLWGADPKAAMDEDLARFKSQIESGSMTAAGRPVTREQDVGRRLGATEG